MNNPADAAVMSVRNVPQFIASYYAKYVRLDWNTVSGSLGPQYFTHNAVDDFSHSKTGNTGNT